MWDFLKIDLLLNKKYTQNFNERYLKEKKVKDQIRKIVSQKKHPKSMSLYESFSFSEGDIGVAKHAFSR